MPDGNARRRPEQTQPKAFQGRPDLTAKRQSTENQTHAQKPEQDHAALLGCGLGCNVATVGVVPAALPACLVHRAGKAADLDYRTFS